MGAEYDSQKQFSLEPWDFLNKLDFIDWYRFFFIIKGLAALRPKRVLEIGPGVEAIKHVVEPFVETYETMDVNAKLKPTHIGDVRTNQPHVHNRYDAIVAADILEHIPFENLSTALKNFHNYLRTDGKAYITIPHRASYFLFMTPRQVPRALRIPTGFLSFGAFYRRFIKRKIWIDPDHQWEIGDGKHSIKDVEKIMKKAGFTIEKRELLIYVDFWVLQKS